MMSDDGKVRGGLEFFLMVVMIWMGIIWILKFLGLL
jgi:hypothetical protein